MPTHNHVSKFCSAHTVSPARSRDPPKLNLLWHLRKQQICQLTQSFPWFHYHGFCAQKSPRSSDHFAAYSCSCVELSFPQSCHGCVVCRSGNIGPQNYLVHVDIPPARLSEQSSLTSSVFPMYTRHTLCPSAPRLHFGGS